MMTNFQDMSNEMQIAPEKIKEVCLDAFKKLNEQNTDEQNERFASYMNKFFEGYD